jgi:hypothetical protein
MLIKFLAHGSGDPRRAAAYLTGILDHKGHARAGVQVLRGNPALVAEVAATTKNVHKYTSGVIAWAGGDAPRPEEIEQVLIDFERVAYAGLDPEQYAWSAVQHVSDDGSTHVHVFTARVELTTGKALNIAPPGWKKAFDPWRDYWNLSKGWARPDDPNRARVLQPGSYAKASRKVSRPVDEARDLIPEMGLDALDIEAALASEPDPKRWIADLLIGEILAERINSREDLLNCMRRFGDVNRVSDQFISLRLRGRSKPIRFKGRLFEIGFDAQAVRDEAAQPSEAMSTRQAPDLAAAAVAKATLARVVGARVAYNHRRYPFSASVMADRGLRGEPTQGLTPDPPESMAPLSPITSPVLQKDRQHDRSTHALVGQFEAVLRAAGDAIGRNLRACHDAVRASGPARRASVDTLQASDRAVRAGAALERAHRVLAAFARRLGSVAGRTAGTGRGGNPPAG